MGKFIDRRKDGCTTFTLSGTQTFMWQFENRLMSLSLSLMQDIDKKCEKLREEMEKQFYWVHDPENKVWWSLKDFQHEPSPFFREEDRTGLSLLLQIRDFAPDECPFGWAERDFTAAYVLRPGFGYKAALERYMEEREKYRAHMRKTRKHYENIFRPQGFEIYMPPLNPFS